MRIAVYSTSPRANSGYGSQTRMLLPRLTADGHDVCVLGLWGNQVGWDVFATPNGNVPIWPMGNAHYGIDVVEDQARDFKPDWVITLFDVWVMRTSKRLLWEDQRVASWTPIDHNPVTPDVVRWAKAHRTIAMSEFGRDALKVAAVDSTYIPHGLEPVWKPTPSDARKQIGIPEDTFFVMMNAANIRAPHIDRKAFWENLQAFAIFQKTHPEAHLYLHTDPLRPDGTALLPMLSFLQVPSDNVHFPPLVGYRGGFITNETLAENYSAADVLLACSRGEGFGLPVAEAMACGTPAIVTDWTAQPEIVGDTGWKVYCEPAWDEPQRSCFAQPSVASIVEALEEAYAEKGTERARERSAAAQERARSRYDADTVYAEKWRPYLAELEAELRPARKGMSNAARRRNRKRAA